MEVEYELSEEDVIALVRFQSEHSPRPGCWENVKTWFWMALFGIIVVLTIPTALKGTFLPLAIYGGGFAITLLLIFFWRPLAIWRLKRSLKDPNNAGLMGLRRLAIDPEGLTVSTPLSSHTVKWTVIVDIVLDEDHAFFYTSPTEAIPLPARSFSSYHEFEDFVEEARRFHQAASEAEPSGA